MWKIMKEVMVLVGIGACIKGVFDAGIMVGEVKSAVSEMKSIHKDLKKQMKEYD